MKTLITLVLVSMTLCHLHHHHRPHITSSHIKDLKSMVSWQVLDYENHPFKNYSIEQLKRMLGLRRPEDYIPRQINFESLNTSLPDSFDSRQQWPNCVHPIRDQGQCGSCWAFAASEVLSDRFCIKTNGNTNVVLSPQDLVSCDHSDFGCQGGMLDSSWKYLVNTGIVSDECLPYSSGDGSSAECPNAGNCKSGIWRKFKASTFNQFNSIEEIKQSIFIDGPVEAGFDVYDDFFSYSGGIYVRSSDNLVGGHAVKTIGWGVENGIEYWIVANSWATKWGENGYFRIKFRECNIDSEMIAGIPDTSVINKLLK